MNKYKFHILPCLHFSGIICKRYNISIEGVDLVKKKYGSYFTRIYFAISLLASTLIIFGISYLYYTTHHSVETNVANSKIANTVQMHNTIEREIQTIESLFNTYSTTASFNEMVQKPLRITNYRKHQEIQSQLNYFATLSLANTTFSLTSLDQRWQVREGRLTELTELDVMNLNERFVEDSQNSFYWQYSPDGITAISLLPIYSANKLAIGMAEVPAQSLNTLLTLSPEDPPLYILSQSGEIIYQAGEPSEEFTLTALEIEQLRAQPAGNKTGLLTSAASGPERQLIFSRSDYNRWTYVTFLNQAEIAQAMAVSRYGLFALSIILIAALNVIAYLLALHWTRPIAQLRNTLSLRPVSAGSVVTDDLQFITESVNSLMTEKAALETLYEREKPELKKQFMLNLYVNRLLESEIQQKVQEFHYPYTSQGACTVMLVQIDDFGTRDLQNRDIFLLAINKLAEELIPMENRFTPILLNETLQTTLLAFPQAEAALIKKQASGYAEALQKYAKEYLHISISVAFSPFYNNLIETKDQLEKTRKALSYHLILGKESIIFHDEIKNTLTDEDTAAYPLHLEQSLLEAIRLGEVAKALETAELLLDRIMLTSTDPVQLKISFLQLALGLIQLTQSLQATTLTQEDGIQLYQKIIDVHNPDELRTVLVSHIILPLTEEMQEKNNREFKGLSEQIIKIIEEEYDQDISLEIISDRIHYNPNYLSNIFKKETGITFSDYLACFRFDLAKQWLRETDYTIKDISERLQYRNSQNFIRSFKKRENITPGEYRKVNTPV